MASSVDDAAAGARRVAATISGVAGRTQGTESELERTRTAVEELSRMAAELRTTVSRFSY